jgi:hypothetical protein
MPRHITVVYTIHDEASAKDELENLGQRYQAYDPENPRQSESQPCPMPMRCAGSS